MKQSHRRGLGALVSAALLASGLGTLASPATAAPGVDVVGPVRLGAVVTMQHDPVPAGATPTYRWMAAGDDGEPREVSTSRSYRIESDLLGDELIGMMRYDGSEVWADNAGTVEVGRLTVTPKVTGTGAVGSPLKLTTTIVDDSGQTPLGSLGRHVQWLRNGTPIIGRTGNDFYSSSDDYGKQVWARIEISSSWYQTAVVESARTTIPSRLAARSTLRVKLQSPKPRTVRVRVTVTAPGLKPSGKVMIMRGTKEVGDGKVKKGKATVTLKRQKPGKATYQVFYSGGPDVLGTNVTRKVTVRG